MKITKGQLKIDSGLTILRQAQPAQRKITSPAFLPYFPHRGHYHLGGDAS